MTAFSEPDKARIQDRLGRLFIALEHGLLERGEALRLSLLAAIAGESVFLLGPPGVAKSLLARRLQHAFAGARCFDYLMGRFSTPEELFGPVSIKRLKDEDLYVRRTENYLPEADIVFLDEIWKAGPPIQNALLTALNEKIFRNGNEELRLPLKLLLAASNETASDDGAQAFWDRFLIRLELRPLREDAAFQHMLADLEDPYRDTVEPALKISADEWKDWQHAASRVVLDGEVLAMLAVLRRSLAELHAAGKGPYVSDRRWKKLAGLIRASAFCHGRQEASVLDCFVLEHGLWNDRQERSLVAHELRQAIQKQAGLQGQGLDGLGSQLEAIKESFARETRSSDEIRTLEPELADGEYYRLANLPQDMASERSGGATGLEVRIWKLDFETLPENGRTDKPSELFVYRAGQYGGTVTRPCRRGKGWALVVSGQEIPLVCGENLRTVQSHLKPDAASWAKWDSRLAEFKDACQAEAKRISQRLQALQDEIAGHYFLPADAAEPATFQLRRMLVALADLESSASGCLESQGDC